MAPGAQTFSNAPAPLSPRVTDGQDEVEEVKGAAQGISILKEIFPDHGEATPKGKQTMQKSILGSIPSPARAAYGNHSTPSNSVPFGNHSTPSNSVPFGPPAHMPMQMAAPVMPPPPPLMPAPTCQERWEPPRATGPLLSEPAFGSYRERLRAGGRGAFQRAFDNGIVPKNMKQEWGAQQMSSAPMMQGQQMSYGDAQAQQMWAGAGQMQSNDYYQAQYTQDYCSMQMPQNQEMQHMSPMNGQQMQHMSSPMAMQSQQMMLPQMAVQQPQMQMTQMQVQQMPLQLPQMAMHQGPVSGTASGESTPTEIESVQAQCFSILMPQAAQMSPDMLAAQLKASADCQRYED